MRNGCRVAARPKRASATGHLLWTSPGRYAKRSFAAARFRARDLCLAPGVGEAGGKRVVIVPAPSREISGRFEDFRERRAAGAARLPNQTRTRQADRNRFPAAYGRRANTYSALPVSGCATSGLSSAGTRRGLPPPSPVGTATYWTPSTL